MQTHISSGMELRDGFSVGASQGIYASTLQVRCRHPRDYWVNSGNYRARIFRLPRGRVLGRVGLLASVVAVATAGSATGRVSEERARQ